jgi:hypothetical protein
MIWSRASGLYLDVDWAAARSTIVTLFSKYSLSVENL